MSPFPPDSSPSFSCSPLPSRENKATSRGSSISTEDDTTTILVSPSGEFSYGFYKVATNAFTFSIWFSTSADKTVAWTANRDAPVNGKGSKLVFQKDGRLALLNYNGTAVWSTNTTTTRARSAQLLDTGNLVVMDPDGQHLWQSFDSPTDTLLPLQLMTWRTKLVSASAKGLLYSGSYNFYFNMYRLSLVYTRNGVPSQYWPRKSYDDLWEIRWGTYNDSQYGVLDQRGTFASSDGLEFEACDIMRRLTLDYDGNLRLYSLNATNDNWSVSWMATPRIREIHGVCGVNSLCKYIPKLECSCLEGFEMIEPTDWSRGCSRLNQNSTLDHDFSFRKLPGTYCQGNNLHSSNLVTLQFCQDKCASLVDCQAFGYQKGTGQCYPKYLLSNGNDFTDSYSDIYLKVPRAVLSLPKLPYTGSEACENTDTMVPPSRQKFKFVCFLSSALALLVIEVVLIALGCWIVYNWETRTEATDEGSMIISSQFRRFRYKNLQKATGYFKAELGCGGSAAVYKGVLDDERKVAVKKLNDVIQGEQKFRSELSVIGRIYHMNVLRIWGVFVLKILTGSWFLSLLRMVH